MLGADFSFPTMKRATTLLLVLSVLYIAACTAAQKQAALSAGIATGIDALNGASQKQLEIDGAKGALKVIGTP